MKVEIWSDFACPFCYIGKRHFEQALSQCDFKDDIEVVFRSFELDPNADANPGANMHELLAQKYGMSIDKAKAMNAQMTERAQAAGLTFHFDTIKPTNTFDAHRLTHMVKPHGKMYEMAERLFHAYFTESRHLADHQTLAELAVEVGLSREEALKVLKSDQYRDEVRSDEQEAQGLGIQGVPFFVINRRYAVSGAQPVEVFVEALQKARSEEKPLTIVSSNSSETDDAVCADGTCEVPATSN